jgi:hypothetical protein
MARCCCGVGAVEFTMMRSYSRSPSVTQPPSFAEFKMCEKKVFQNAAIKSDLVLLGIL